MSNQTEIVHNQQVDEALFAKMRQAPILSSLKDDEIRCLKGVEEICLNAGEVLAVQGEIGHFFWILLEGEIGFYYASPDGNEMMVASLTAGLAFGEVPLLANLPNAASLRASSHCCLAQFDEESFWNLMTTCPDVRKSILGNMANRIQKIQSMNIQKEKMATLGTLAAGLMHELNNPGAAARRAASQLRENLMRMHELSLKFKERELTLEQKHCMLDLQKQALANKQPIMMNSLEQSDAEEALAEWMESANIDNAWKMAPTLVSVGINTKELTCLRDEFDGPLMSEALGWLEAMVSSMQLVGTIEESVGRVTDLVKAVKSYAYEGRGQKQTIDINDSIHATMVILAHKLREKEIVVEKSFSPDLPALHSECSGLNQIWTNLLDNAIDAVSQHGIIRVRTWSEKAPNDPTHTDLCISVKDNGTGIPLESQAQIFDPFYTTKPVGVGTGIGLGIVQRIVEEYGGTIRFTSEPGNTEFVVRLPSEHEQKAAK